MLPTMPRTNAACLALLLAVAQVLSGTATHWFADPCGEAQPSTMPYCDGRLSVAERAEDLVARLTLDEKARGNDGGDSERP